MGYVSLPSSDLTLTELSREHPLEYPSNLHPLCEVLVFVNVFGQCTYSTRMSIKIWRLIALWLIGSFWIGYLWTFWVLYRGPAAAQPACNVCFGHCMLWSLLTLVHGAACELVAGWYTIPGLQSSLATRPWRPLLGYAMLGSRRPDPEQDQQRGQGKTEFPCTFL